MVVVAGAVLGVALLALLFTKTWDQPRLEDDLAR